MQYTLRDGRKVELNIESGPDIKDLDIWLTLEDGSEVEIHHLTEDEARKFVTIATENWSEQREDDNGSKNDDD